MTDQPTYSTGLSAKGALLAETLAALRQLNHGGTVARVKAMVFDQDLLGKTTFGTSKSVWDKIHHRFLRDSDNARILARMVTRD